ncbi:NAD(P)-dependent oxidoreductase [Microbacterium sp. SS28]|uniref:NAD-dependent epimerase/dehydratase family protein n=1 Tax=Microbacterium sp. SS28 TaxID=2919948 RepID=UPI001FAA7652|nr:NAD(P)-dependent oxidoreductase [Microbacterium sp. SS28]
MTRRTPAAPTASATEAAAVWVSGSRGKLGREVCRQLRAVGVDVLEADRQGPSPVDLTDADQVARSMRGATAIIHCAAIPTPEHTEPSELVRNNTMACFNALEQAWQAGIRTAVVVSSGSVYGTSFSPEPLFFSALPVGEWTPLEFVDPYALSKDFSERMGEMYARRGMTVTALRPQWILTSGEAERIAHSRSDADGAASLWGWIHLEDAARACVLALQPQPEHRGYEALVIASDETLSETPTSDLLDRHLPAAVRRRDFPGHEGGFDSSRAAVVLGWRPTRSWRDR